MKFTKRYLLIPLLLVGLAYLFYASYGLVKQKTFSDFNEAQFNTAKVASLGIASFFEYYQGGLEFLTSFPDVVDFNMGGEKLLTKFYFNHSDEIKAITRVDPTGKLLFTFPYSASATGKDISYQNHVQTILRNQEPIVSDVFLAVQGYYAIAYHIPVFDGNEYTGSLAILISLEHLGKKYLETLKMEGAGYAWLMSKDGIELYCPVPDNIGHSIGGKAERFPKIARFLDQVRNEKTGNCMLPFDHDFNQETSGRKNHTTFFNIPLSNTYWTIILSVPEKEIYETLAGFRNRLMLIFFLTSVVLGFYFYSFAKARTLLKEGIKIKAVEQSLRESEERWLFALEGSGDGVWDWNIETNVVFFSKRWKEMLGFEDHEIQNHFDEWSQRLHPDDIEWATAEIDKYLQGKIENYYVEHRLLCKDGHYKWILTRGKIMTRSPEGKPLRLVGTHTDITERKQMLDTLRQLSRRNEAILAAVPELIMEVDVNKIYTWANDAGVEFFGDDILGKEADFYFEGDQETYTVVKPLFAGLQDAIYLESWQRRRDGEKRLLAWWCRSLKGADGVVTGALSTARDITEYRLAEQALQESQSFNQTLLDTSPDIIYVYDLVNRKNIYSNQGITKILGYSLDKIQTMGENVLPDLMHPDDFMSYVNDIIPRYQTLRDGEILTHEYRMKHKDGSWIWLLSRESVFQRLDDGSPQHLFGLTSDINESKKAKAQIRKNEELFRKAFLTSPDSININRLEDGLYTSINDGFTNIMGYSPSDVIGKSSLEINIWVNPEDREKLVAGLRKDGSIQNLEAPFRKKSGEQVTGLMSATIIELDQVPHILSITRDITNLKEDEKELKKYRDDLEEMVKVRTQQLEATNKELEAFSYSVSHDLRAPLRAIDGFSNILMEDYASKLDDEGKRLGSVIQSNAKKMGQLIDDLLAFSRTGRSSINPSSIDMKELVHAIYHEVTSPAQRARIRFELSDLPKTSADPTMMRQVWMNLISNAIKFSANRKQAVISVSCQQEEGQFIYCIQDNGAGFNMEYKEKLFGVFQRLHGEKEFEGTGVGLALVQRIIHRHGGEVWGEGEVDKGAIFYFSLPK